MKTTRQHIIPNFYLKEFFPGFIYHRGEKYPRFTRKAKNVAVRVGYYGKAEEELIPLDKINDVVESEAAPVLKKILSDVTTMTSNDWVTLSYFFANMAVRTPAFHEVMLKDYQYFASEVNKLADKMMESYKSAKTEGKDLSINDTPYIDEKKGLPLEAINKWIKEMEAEDGHVKVAEGLYYQIREIVKYIQKMSLHVLTASGGLFFVTTDRPLVLFSLVSGSTLGAGWGNSDAVSIMPLNPKTLLLLAYRGKPAAYNKDLNVDDVRFFNIEIMKYAQKEIYSKYPYDLAADWMHRQGIWEPRDKRL